MKRLTLIPVNNCQKMNLVLFSSMRLFEATYSKSSPPGTLHIIVLVLYIGLNLILLQFQNQINVVLLIENPINIDNKRLVMQIRKKIRIIMLNHTWILTCLLSDIIMLTSWIIAWIILGFCANRLLLRTLIAAVLPLERLVAKNTFAKFPLPNTVVISYSCSHV